MEGENLQSCPIIEEIHQQNETILESLQTKVEKWNGLKNRIMSRRLCPSGLKCNRSIYNVRTELTKSAVLDDNKAIVDIQIESPTVQNVIDSYSYDSQSLVGEIGGTLGLFLGLSTYSFVEFITYILEKFFCH